MHPHLWSNHDGKRRQQSERPILSNRLHRESFRPPVSLPIPTTTLSHLAQSPAADPAAIALLTQTPDFETAFDSIIASQYPDPQSFSDPTAPKPSLWKLFLKRIQQEVCGTDDSLRSLIQETKKNPGNATLVTGMITAIVNLSGFPLPIDSAIATALAQPTGTGIALYLLHISIDVFCEWSSPTPEH